jgi:prepilin-type N-terminal cleavage/methylation domain-containing protein
MSEPVKEVDRRAGFTLLELMLAMTALALLTAVCYGAFHLAIRAIERGEMAVTTAQRLRATSDVLRQIRSTMYRLERNKEGDSFPYFRGTATSLSFDTNLRLQGGGGVTRVSYQVLDNPTRLVLTESESPAHGGGSRRGRDRDRDDKPPQQSTVLLEGFRSLRFTYFDPAWEQRSSWETDPERGDSDQEGLPLAVQLEIDGLPGIESGRWGAAFPIAVVALNESVSEGGADTLEEVFGTEQDDEDLDDEDEEDEDDTGRSPAASRPGARSRAGSVDDE